MPPTVPSTPTHRRRRRASPRSSPIITRPAERDELRTLLAARDARIVELEGQQAPAAAVSRFAGVSHDWDQAANVPGKRIKLDDLKVVEGIGPKIEELCHAGGVTTWAGLAETPVERLREILDTAGERFRIHNPSSWPRQAELLALGQWDEFKQLTDELTAGRD